MIRKRKPFNNIRRSHFPVNTTTGENVETLLGAGVFDAQGLSSRESSRLVTRLGLKEIAAARDVADEIEAETGERPLLYGRQILEVVKTARQTGDPEAEAVQAQREQLHSSLAEQTKHSVEA